MASTTRRYNGMSADDRLADRRARLLDAGLEVFAKAGAQNTTMTAICAEAKLTERYFYENFTGRDELLERVVDSISDDIRSKALDALHSPAPTVEEQVHNAIAAFVGVLTEDPRKGRVAMIESLAVDSLRAYRRKSMRAFAHLVAEQSRELYGEQAFPQPQSEINGLLFIGGLAELVIAWLNDEIDITPADIVAAATRQFIATAHR
ncbi:TetR/AcrR family transcriptional regulator [Rhodococcus sp. ARC_M5]|uniref:TetR/AcrR family transcriptional regulator n=1 Tax=Rhodococcus sp. ARC_M5 TaxID=2928851 RepID=UPI001FB54C42|nr:helix-turn-helix domain-containing protein [Rhodococcus sp. ARC_M5]MCJ0894946.1 TetR/AcrR family transcriptional regulator [Rhodococcus sp. ARC_M5]